MLIKLEIKSARVKGLTFHPKRPWILSSLHDGSIQLWDYRLHILLEKFEEHIGPVRGINFHLQQPLFVSGGDDYKVKVWNYKSKFSMFTLLGHIDYIRTVNFHHEYPWIVSASDDQTIKLWNWQNRSCILTITGHNHYVMCAVFHPSLDLIASASLDASIRIWDISFLVSKQLKEEKRPEAAVELFGHSYAVVKHILEGHERGVNWVTFHPDLPLIVSAADDKLVKLWRMNDFKAWEIQNFRGHYNNVSGVVLDSDHDYIVSNSEDKSIRVWDIAKQTCIHTYRREHDRFWCLTFHPKINSIAAGHDSGLIIFKVQRERPVYTVIGDSLFYVKGLFLRRLEFSTSKDVQQLQIKPNEHNLRRTLSINASDGAILISTKHCSLAELSFYELYRLTDENIFEETAKKNSGMIALWVTRNKYVVLDTSCHLILKNTSKETKKKLLHPHCEEIFNAGTGLLLLKTQEQIYLYDVQQMKVLNKIKVNKCRYVVWSSDTSLVALLSKNSISLCDKKLKLICTINERLRVKSGAWDTSSVFIYTTTNQIKYLLTNGDNGTIRTLDVPIYITKVDNDKVFCLDRSCQVLVFNNNSTEYRFKLALISKQQDQILQMIKNSKLVGQSIVFYLKEKGHSDIALQFIQNQKVRFDLAVECGNIQIALDAAKKLNENAAWAELADLALWQGNLNILEQCYQQTKNFHKLLFIYLITGNSEKMKIIQKIAASRNDVSAQYQNALLLGDVKERVNILRNNKLFYYAFITASTHGLYSEADDLRDTYNYGNNDLLENAKFFAPPLPIQKDPSNWPLLSTTETIFSKYLQDSGKLSMQVGAGDSEQGNWIEDEPNLITDNKEGWEIDSATSLLNLIPNNNDFIYLPLKKQCNKESKLMASKIVINYVSLGNFQEAFQYLNKQFGIVEFETFGDLFLGIFSASRSISTRVCHVLPQLHHLETDNKNSSYHISFEQMVRKLQDGYSFTTSGNFVRAVNIFRTILREIALIVITSKKEATEMENLVKICRNYICGLQMESHRKDLYLKTPQEVVKQCEMVAYLTHCNLQQPHQILALRSALNLFYKVHNYKSAVSFGKRLLQLCPKQEVASQTQKIIKYCESNSCDAVAINYDERNPFEVCGYSYQAIYRGSSCVQCPFCQSFYFVKYKGCVCNICKVAEIGIKATGLRLKC